MQGWKSLKIYFGAICVALLLTACGGNEDQIYTEDVTIDMSYSPSNGEEGVFYSYYPYFRSSNKVRPTFKIQSGSLPPGLGISAGDGRISGVPTQAGIYSFTVRFTADNLQGNIDNHATIYVRKASTSSSSSSSSSSGGYSSSSSSSSSGGAVWNKESDASGLPKMNRYNAVTVGDRIYVVGSNETTKNVEVWQSSTDGLSYTNLNVSAPKQLRNFAIATDGTRIFLTGGVNLQIPADQPDWVAKEIWSWSPGDSNWASATSTDMPSIYSHAMLYENGKLFLFGGTVVDSSKHSSSAIWTSSDMGSHWVQVNTSGYGGESGCAFVSQGWMYVMEGSQHASGKRSIDGVSWTSTGAGLGNPNNNRPACVGHNKGGIFVPDMPYYSASPLPYYTLKTSPNSSTPQWLGGYSLSDTFLLTLSGHGLAVLGDKVYLLGGHFYVNGYNTAVYTLTY